MTERGTRGSPWTLSKIRAAIVRAGRDIDASTLRYACRKGALKPYAQQVGKTWVVPAGIAADYAEHWRPRHRWTPVIRAGRH